ncbi:MAG: hypothetical protein KF832_05885 [Caldilineaceae bacterium]|nr:hypothetical protein [Caldilineaceae bacterium]
MKKIYLLQLLWALFWISACVPTTATPKQYTVTIVDAESGAPIEGAAIDLHYFPSAPEAPAPDHPQATADAQGEVKIQSKADPAIWQVRADGYIEQRLSTSNGALPLRYAAHATTGLDGVIQLYQQPEPRLTILVSDTYSGPLTIDLQPAPGFDYRTVDEMNVTFAAVAPTASYIQEVAGQRVFTATAAADGQVALVVTPLLYDIENRHLQIQDATGPLPFYDIADANSQGRGVWGTVNDDDKRLNHQIRLFIGTLQEYQASLQPGS